MTEGEKVPNTPPEGMTPGDFEAIFQKFCKARSRKPPVPCPKCGEEIDFLYNYTKTKTKSELHLDEDGAPHYEGVAPLLEGEEDGDYECPECNECLTQIQSEAIRILKGKPGGV